ncbi:PREDICTED: uncharacterized protein LOC105569227 isoform X2 [Vollenhovia emeryi]|uniref:uncharacterized protein LOC105569227 isoform X2 n=1 Tax=Vollenhovia emeryi TaxID=411798 RepID=UPI0005F4C9A1|nr:PREDICTED: uncharacterized protein LOC105569227 isoform X2 [Vollenhovia emeryi]
MRARHLAPPRAIALVARRGSRPLRKIDRWWVFRRSAAFEISASVASPEGFTDCDVSCTERKSYGAPLPDAVHPESCDGSEKIT